MLPNFTVVICGAILTVLMLAVAGSGLIEPQTRTRIGAMPEIGRPMMQRMITEPARGQFAALDMSRRGKELIRLRDLAPAVADPASIAEHDDPAQPAEEAAASPPQPSPSPDATVPAASTAAAPAAVAEAEPAAGAAAIPPGTEAPPAVAEPTSSTAAREAPVAEAVPPRDTAGAPAEEDSKLAPETVVETSPVVETPPVAIASPTETPEKVAAAASLGAPAMEEHNEPAAELPALQQLALAEPDAVPAPEAPAKLAARTGEPEEAAPIRRVMPHFMPLLPRMTPLLMRRFPLQPHLAPSVARVTPLVRRVYRPEIMRAVVAPKKPVGEMVRQMQYRAQHAYAAPSTAVRPYPTHRVSRVQYK